MPDVQTAIVKFLNSPSIAALVIKAVVFSVVAALICLWGMAILNNKPLTIVKALAHAAVSTFVSIITLLILIACKAVTLIFIVTPIAAFFAEPIITYLNTHKARVFSQLMRKWGAIWQIIVSKNGDGL